MDAKDLQAEAALTERTSDGGAKFALQYDRSKCYEAGATVFKGDAAGARPCAVIGPDRVVQPARDCPKKAPAEPWLVPDPVYRRLPDYPHKMSDHKDLTRNISPRQTFQENMQRIIMPPGYNGVKLHEEPAYSSKNNKLNVPLEVKYCEVPYNINPLSSDQKHIRNTDHSAPNVNPLLMRGVPHGWPAGGVNVRPLRPYGAPEVLQYPDYANCTGPRPMLTRAHTGTEELQQLYPDPYYHENNLRFKPYPNIKERYPQARYEYLGNFTNPYHPPLPYAHKYELPKTMPPNAYPGYPPVPVKYTERASEPLLDGYQRAFNQQGNYSVPIRNPVIHPPYRPVPGSQIQNKLNPYPPEGQHKSAVPNKMPYDPSSKMYLDYDPRSKPLPTPDSYYLNEIPRPYHGKNAMVLPNYAHAGMHGVNTHPYYTKDNIHLKNYEYARFKNMDPSMIGLPKLPPQFSPSIAISPADSNASNEMAQTHGTSQEDCGYVSQSSVTSVRSIESLSRIPMDLYGRYDYRYGPVAQTSPSAKPDPNCSQSSKSKKDIRQFISSWSEGDEENAENVAKRDSVKNISDGKHAFNKQYEAVNNQEQLYVLGLVNVPSEELSKYEHIQKVSKLPENIKGYNSLELLNQFEEAIESSNMACVKPNTPRAIQMPLKTMPPRQKDTLPRAVSPLDVEAKISQSVIHKDVGCNFEIKPCSPKMLNVEVATPMQTLMNERVIEKVANPNNIKSPVIQSVNENIENALTGKVTKCPIPNISSSCKMINNLSETSAIEHLKTNYSLQDLESNSGVCLASLPRLDTDIELNFPEVNQQFINANKTESSMTTSLIKELPSLDTDRPDSSKNTINVSDYDMNYQFSPKMETETEFSRLSKYRKIKKSVPNDNDIAQAKAQATRVDSVIIKNPDNTRSLEGTNDSLIGGSYYRNDFQEFAINLVSQAKNSKDQNEVNKVYETCTSKCDEISICSPNHLSISKSSNLFHKQFNLIEESCPNDTIQEHSEDLSIQNKNLSNRHFDKAELDIPINLSPQAKYSMVEVDEEIRNNKADDDIKHKGVLDMKHQLGTVIPSNSKELPEKQEHTSYVNPDSAEDTLLSSQKQNPSGEEPSQKLRNPSSSSNSNFSKGVIEIDKHNHAVSNIDEVHGTPKDITNSACVTIENQVDSFSVEENYNELGKEEVGQVNEVVDDSKQEGNGSTDVHNVGINLKNDVIDSSHNIQVTKNQKTIENMLILSKSKKKKHKTQITHRKRETEKKPERDIDRKVNSKREKYKKALNDERDGSLIQTSHVVTSNNVASAENDKLQKGVYNEACVDKIEKMRTSSARKDVDIASTSLHTENAPKKGSKEKRKRKQNVIKKPLNYETEDFLLQTLHVVTSHNVVSAENYKSQNSICNAAYVDNIEIIKASSALVDVDIASTSQTDNAQVKDIKENDVNITDRIKYDCSEKGPSNNSCLYKKEIENETNLVTQDVLFTDSEVTKGDEKNNSHRQSSLIANFKDETVLSNENLKDFTSENLLSFDESESESKLSPSTTSIHFEEKEKEKPVLCDDQQSREILIHASIDYENKELVLPVVKYQGENKSKQTITKASNEHKELELFEVLNPDETREGNEMSINAITVSEKNELNIPVFSNQDESMSEDIQSREELEFANYDLTNFQMNNTKDNFTTINSGNNINKYLKNDMVPHHSYITKELYSSRFQNLLFFHEYYSSDVDKPKTIITTASSLKQDVLREDSKTYTTPETEIVLNTDQHTDDFSELSTVTGNVLLGSPDKIEINILETKKKLDEEVVKSLDVVSEDEPISNNLSNVDSKDEIENKIVTNIHEIGSFSEIDCCFENRNEVFDVNQVITTSDISQEITEKVITDSSEKSNTNEFYESDDMHALESVAESTNNIETNTCEGNIIVSDETGSETPQHCNEDRKIVSDVNNFELDKKTHSFQRNVNSRGRPSLKRSLSDSALNAYDDDVEDSSEKRCFMLPKRKKLTEIGNIDESHLLNIIQSSRRNSISTLCNENFSFCILIDDNCIVAEENYEQDNGFIQLDDDSVSHTLKDSVMQDESVSTVYNTVDENELDSITYATKCPEEKPWVDDVGCEETIETEDIAENIVIGEPASPKDSDLSDFDSDDESVGIFNNDDVDHTSKVKHIYGDNLCRNDARLVDALYRTPQMDVNKKLMDRESQVTEKNTEYYDNDSLELLLSEPVNSIPNVTVALNSDVNNFEGFQESIVDSLNKDDVVTGPVASILNNAQTNISVLNENNVKSIKSLTEPVDGDKNETTSSCEQSLDDESSYNNIEDSSYTSSSSPEVSSTTSEEKKTSILLKISKFEGSRKSEVKNATNDRQNHNSCKFTEKEYLNPNYNNNYSTNKPLLTKGAQKYIPPLRESVPDLKVKLPLPPQSLLKLQRNKMPKEEPKVKTHCTYSNTADIKFRKEIPKKVKPKFEDVLKNIDEVQFQKHKEKNKKPKKYIPKVVIKKNENGSHYASTSRNESFNPDLTGRKWQPWVFIEKNQFIDKMALRNKTRAVFSHRRKSYVLIEKVYKYKSISSAKFIISQPKINDFSTGNLKYTIKLKHTY